MNNLTAETQRTQRKNNCHVTTDSMMTFNNLRRIKNSIVRRGAARCAPTKYYPDYLVKEHYAVPTIQMDFVGTGYILSVAAFSGDIWTSA